MRRKVLGAACLALLAGAVFGMGACGGSDPLVLSVDFPKDKVPFDGRTAAKVSVKVTRGENAVNAGMVTFTSDLDGSAFSEPIEDSSEMPAADARKFETELLAGTASASLYSISSGTAKVTIIYVDDESGATASQDVNVTFGQGGTTTVKVASIEFVSAEPSVLQLKGSGNETSRVTFKVLDNSKAPLKDVDIKFELGSELGGASLEPTTARSADGGLVSTNLTSGTTFGTVKVRASTADGSVTGLSGDITVAGSPANHKHFTFRCEEHSLAGLAKVGLYTNCSAHVADRSSQKIPGVQVTFETEAGSVDRFATTGEDGVATTSLKSQEPYPVDVAPNPGFLPSWMEGENGTEPSQPCPYDASKVCNPRDGLVTLIAVTAGEEEWTDDNENGVWDEGESFVDLPEPYVDTNDNGRFDSDDPRERDLYIDANENGRWDDKNGHHDASTLIWKAEKVVFTGPQDDSISGVYDSNKQKISALSVPHCPIRPPEVSILAVDANLNFLTRQDGDTMTCTCVGEGCTVYPDTVTFGGSAVSGKHFVGPFGVGDAHSCDPDCKGDDPPCGPTHPQLECQGHFKGSAEGEDDIIEKTYRIYVDVQ